MEEVSTLKYTLPLGDAARFTCGYQDHIQIERIGIFWCAVGEPLERGSERVRDMLVPGVWKRIRVQL